MKEGREKRGGGREGREKRGGRREGREKRGGGRREERREEEEGGKRGDKVDTSKCSHSRQPPLCCAGLTSRGSGQCAVRRWLWSAAVPPLLTSHNTRVSETVHSNGME